MGSFTQYNISRSGSLDYIQLVIVPLLFVVCWFDFCAFITCKISRALEHSPLTHQETTRYRLQVSCRDKITYKNRRVKISSGVGVFTVFLLWGSKLVVLSCYICMHFLITCKIFPGFINDNPHGCSVQKLPTSSDQTPLFRAIQV